MSNHSIKNACAEIWMSFICNSVNFSSCLSFQVFSFSVANSVHLPTHHDLSHILYSELFSTLLCAKTDKTNSISLPLLCVYMLRVHVNINTTYIYHELTFTQHTWVGRITGVSWLGEIWGVWLLCTAYYNLWRPGADFYCSRRRV